MSEKTEQPTPKKLRDARKKGQVAKSKEIPSAAVLLGVFAVLWGGWGFYLDNLKQLMVMPADFYNLPFEEALVKIFTALSLKLVILSLPVVAVALVLAALGNFFQIGFLFAPESVKPDPKKLNPTQGLKKIFSSQGVIEMIKSIIKMAFLGAMLTMIIKGSIADLMILPEVGMHGVGSVLGELMKEVVIYTAAAFIIVAAADFFLQQKQHIKKLKMTKDEVKREYKEMEGDPIIKSKRKQLHQEMAMNASVNKTRDASVLVTNPTHFAVALHYKHGEGKLPLILAMGEGYLASLMIKTAREEDIPIMRNVPLARGLFAKGRVDDFIPRDFIDPVAEVLRWVQEQQNDPFAPRMP